MNVEVLAERAIAGDEDSFTTLIEGMQERIYRMAFSYVRNKDEALEIVQETVYKAYISIHKLQQPQYFATWLTRIAVNCALDHIRKSQKIIYMEKEPERSYVPGQKEEIIDLYEALDGLDEKSRMVIVMRYLEDLPLKEIAEILEQPLSSVKSVLYRGLEKLKINLEESENLG
ncbi:RNA polymerase subunit sigma-70 [Bacillus sp. FJAT-27264]|uniref:sigma-70 family RNA polymerase sigma factor n=1 Tax=Paenibacillus sp. (strain DSM 101736 / FJAT-27264) TaxID=1850362 RepID=UPI0008080AC8|nr:sigma-70 family RNA polymerase sigma factor [Bacillus sp. FJAT-27264]OBZ18234.1 RNA polymerase subunit sigma-70 [Bacillus sp. FJAT-27264]